MLVHKIKPDFCLCVHVASANISRWKKTFKSPVKCLICDLEEHVRHGSRKVKKKKK